MAFAIKMVIKLPIALLILTLICESLARPGQEWANANVCDDDIQLKLICQRCAKQTKSNLVYPMCCNKQDEVHNWCVRYTNFGLIKEA